MQKADYNVHNKHLDVGTLEVRGIPDLGNLPSLTTGNFVKFTLFTVLFLLPAFRFICLLYQKLKFSKILFIFPLFSYLNQGEFTPGEYRRVYPIY